MHRTGSKITSLLVSVIRVEIFETDTSFLIYFSRLRVVSLVVPFLVIIEACDLEYVFPNPTISTGGRSKASIFSTLVLLVIQMSMFFVLSLSFFIRSLTASSE